MSNGESFPSPDVPFENLTPAAKKHWALKNFHPDVGGQLYESAPGASTIMEVLNNIVRLDELGEWPAEYDDENTNIRVTFPGEGSPEERTIFLPATPDEFYSILAKFKREGTIDPREYPFRPLTTETGERGETAEIDPQVKEMAKLITSIRKISSVEKLASLYTQFEIHKAYPIELLAACRMPDTGETVSVTKEISARAKELFPKRARLATTPEKLAAFATQIAEFYFLKVVEASEKPGAYDLGWDEPTRQEMIQLVETTYIHRIQKQKTKEAIDEIVRAFPLKPVLNDVQERVSRIAEEEKAARKR